MPGDAGVWLVMAALPDFFVFVDSNKIPHLRKRKLYQRIDIENEIRPGNPA